MMKFIRNHSIAIGAIAAISTTLLVMTLVSLYAIHQQNEYRKSKFDEQPATLIQILDFSERSKLQIKSFVDENAEVVGVIAFRRHFSKIEMPVFFAYSNDDFVDRFINEWWKLQNGPNGKSSEELEKVEFSALENTTEALAGKVHCVPGANAALAKMVPGFIEWAPTGCLVTFPPYKAGKETNIALLVLLSVSDSSRVNAMKDKIFALQMDIDNRDYKGRETWIPLKKD